MNTTAEVEAAFQLLGFIFEADDLLEFRTLGRVVSSRWARLGEAAAKIEELAGLGQGVQVYFGANPRSREGGTAKDVALSRCLFADFDGGTTVEQARLRWQDACIPEPTVIVSTGGGVHAWWRLLEPVTDLADWTMRQKALARRLGADQSCTDAPRIMRLPGFVNWKYPHRPLCVVESCEPDNAYSLEEFPEPVQLEEQPASEEVVPGSLGDLSRRFLGDGYLLPGHGRRDTIYTVACDMKARQWVQADAEAAIMRRARLLGLTPDDLADLPRQIGNAFRGDRLPLQGPAEKTLPVVQKLAPELTPVSLGSLCRQQVPMRPEIIHGLLRETEIMNIVSAPKCGKSWLVNDMAICLAAGKPWLDRFQTNPCRVLIIDNELHSETTSNRLPRVLSHHGLSIDDLDGRLDVLNLRGNLRSFDELDGELFSTAEFEAKQYRVIVLDAFYRFNTGENASENDNAYMAGVYNKLDRWASRLKCAFVCVHHSSKGDQGEKEVFEVGSGASSQARAADTHLVLRHHQLDGHVVLDAVVRSFPAIQPFVLQFAWPVFVKTEEQPDQLRQRKNGQVDFDSTELMEMLPEDGSGNWVTSPSIIKLVRKKVRRLGVNKIRDAIREAVELGLLECNGKANIGRAYRRPTRHGRDEIRSCEEMPGTAPTLHTHDLQEVVCEKSVEAPVPSRP